MKTFWKSSPDKCLFWEPIHSTKPSDWNKYMPPYFQRLNKLEDEMAFVILAANVLENEVDNFLKVFIPKYRLIIKENTGFNKKLELIRAFRLIPPQIIEFAECIRKIRNVFAHNSEIDNFNDLIKSDKLSKHIVVLDRLWDSYESEMTYGKINDTYRDKFKDIWRKSLEGFFGFKSSIRLFREKTENKEFIKQLIEDSKNN